MTTANIATLPSREKQLARTIKSLYNQVDLIYIRLNDYKEAPDWVYDNKIRFKTGLNEGDAAKFREDAEGYYFTCDDDIIYPPDYVKKLKDRLDGDIVTIHGKNFHTPIESYYHGAFDKIRCDNETSTDKIVQIPGTGVMAFHTDTIKFNKEDFPRKNMADIWVGIKAKKEGIKINCIAKPRNWITIQHVDTSIWEEEHEKDWFQTRLINDNF